jgi:hypothetical protein
MADRESRADGGPVEGRHVSTSAATGPLRHPQADPGAKAFCRKREKRGKDLAQAQAFIQALEVEDPFALEDALQDAQLRGARWAERLRGR